MKARLSVDFAGIGRVVGIAGAIAWMVVAAWPAEASRLSEVRVGTHPGFTRVVFELDGPAGYRLGEPRGDTSPELLLELDAESAARQISSGKSAIVRSILVQPSDRGATVRIGLAARDVHVTEMILSRPTRIVLDLRPMSETPAWSGSATSKTSQETAKPVASKTEPAKELVATAKASEPLKTASKTAPAPSVPTAVESAAGSVATAAAKTTPKAVETTKSAARDATERMDAIAAAAVEKVTAARDAAAKSAGTLPDVAPDALEKAAALALGDAPAPEPSAEPEALDEGSDFAAAVDPAGEDPFEDIDGAEAAAAAPALRPDRVPGSATEPMRRPTQTASSSGDGGIVGFFTSTTGIVAIGAALVVALFAFFRIRRRGEEEALSSSFMEDEEFSLSGEVEEETEPETEMPAMDAPEIPEPDFAAAPEPQPMMQEPDMEPTPKIAAPTVTPLPAVAPAAATSTDKPDLHEIEQRLSQIESRLDDMTQARERLERQVAAQTEELRVQRAAIARTQRVVRSIARPEEGATEPVPRAPERPGN